MAPEPTAVGRILTQHYERWRELFDAKSKDYNSSAAFGGTEPHKVLGVRGQFADIWRKIWKLKKVLWDGERLYHEDAEEILLDLIGHCFLTLDLLWEQRQEAKRLAAEKEASREFQTSAVQRHPESGVLMRDGDIDKPHTLWYADKPKAAVPHPPHEGESCKSYQVRGGDRPLLPIRPADYEGPEVF